MSWREETPNDVGNDFERKYGRDPYPSDEERLAWEKKNNRHYYNDYPIDDRTTPPPPRTFEEKNVPKTPPPPRTFEEKMDAIIAPSVNMLALKINSVETNEHLAIFEWVKVKLESLIHI